MLRIYRGPDSEKAGASFGMWVIFHHVNIDDTLAQAYTAQYPGLAADHSFYGHWQEMIFRMIAQLVLESGLLAITHLTRPFVVHGQWRPIRLCRNGVSLAANREE